MPENQTQSIKVYYLYSAFSSDLSRLDTQLVKARTKHKLHLTLSSTETMINHVVSTNYDSSLFSFKKSVGLSFLPITLVLFIATNIDQFLNSKIEFILKSQDAFPAILWLWVALSITSSFLFPLLATVIASYNISRTLKTSDLSVYRPQSLTSFVSHTFELSLLESLRAFGSACLWGLLFVIPGIIKYSYYLLTPFVVFFSQKYQKGEVDALEMSKIISKKFWWKLNALIVVFAFLVPVILSTSFDEYTSFKNHFLSASVLVAVSALVTIVFHYLILKNFFVHLAKEELIQNTGDSHGTYV